MSILALLIVYPFLIDDITGAAVITLLLTSILISAMYALAKARIHVIIAAAVGIPWLVVTWVGIFQNVPVLLMIQPILGIAFFLIVISFLVMHIYHTREVTSDILYGAISVYLLAGLMFAEIFFLIQVDPNAFSSVLSWTDRLYYSFSTLTTVGHGDIVANSNIAQAFSNLESVFGVLYTTVILARLVALYTAQHAEKIVKAQTELEIEKRKTKKAKERKD